MKLLTIVVPAYNAAQYLDKSVGGLRLHDERLEVIIVNDGSKDQTAELAQRYVEAAPGIVRLINQENKGHGGACTAGLRAAQGYYVRILDSDDWLDPQALAQLLDYMQDLPSQASPPDLIITNYVYEALQQDGSFRPSPIRYNRVLDGGRKLSWEDFGRFMPWQQLLMHALCYRREVLETIQFSMPEHCFYVDNLFAYVPLPSCRHIVYRNLDLYHYFVGREGQSVTEESLRRNVGQQLRVNLLMNEAFSLSAMKREHPALHRYMYHYFEMLTMTTSVILLRYRSEENLQRFHELWTAIEAHDPATYRQMRKSVLGFFILRGGRLGQAIAVHIYKRVRKILGYT